MIQFQMALEVKGEEYECDIEADVAFGSPAVFYLANGDPGYPEEPDQVEITSISCELGDVMELLEDREIDRLEEEALERSRDGEMDRSEWEYEIKRDRELFGC